MKVVLSKMQSSASMSAVEKGKVLQAWDRFLKSGLKQSAFTKELYRHLSNRCSFIAHFDRDGFYARYFSEPNDRTILFLQQFDPSRAGLSAERGDLEWLRSAAAADLNGAMRQVAGKYVEGLLRKTYKAIRERDVATAHALLAKHSEDASGKDARAIVRKLVNAVKQWAPPRLAQDGDYLDRPGLDRAMEAAEKFLKETT